MDETAAKLREEKEEKRSMENKPNRFQVSRNVESSSSKENDGNTFFVRQTQGKSVCYRNWILREQCPRQRFSTNLFSTFIYKKNLNKHETHFFAY